MDPGTIKTLQALWLQDRFDLTVKAAVKAFNIPKRKIISANRSEPAVYARWAIIETLIPVMGPAAISYLARNLKRTTYSIRNAINDYHGNSKSRGKYERHKSEFYRCLERVLDRNVPSATRDAISQEARSKSSLSVRVCSARRDTDGPSQNDEQARAVSYPVAYVPGRSSARQDMHQSQLGAKHPARSQATL